MTNILGMPPLTYEEWMARLEAEAATLPTRRHLPGQHDQKTHGHGGGGSSSGAVQAGRVNSRKAFLNRRNSEDRVGAKQEAAATVAGAMKSDPVAAVQAALEVEAAGEAQTGRGYLEMHRFSDVAYLTGHPGAEIFVGPTGNYSAQLFYEGDLPDGYRRGVISEPSGDQILKEAAAASFIDRWSRTSNDHDGAALAIQDAIQAELGLTGSAPWDDATAAAMSPGTHAVLRDYARATYTETQADLAARGITSVTVYRGGGSGHLPLELGAQTTATIRPTSSFSADRSTAVVFANDAASEADDRMGAVVRTTVPAARVFATPFTGPGCLEEAEVILTGGALPITIAATVKSENPAAWDVSEYPEG